MKPNVRTFPVEWLERHHIAVEGMSKLVVHREFVEHQEYGSLWFVVFQDEGRYWKASYLEPNTSEVHVDTWGDHLEIPAVEVRPVPKFVTEWVATTSNRGGTCKAALAEAFSDTVLGPCGLAAPFVLAVTKGNKIESLERCVAHAHQMMSSPETFPLIEEVRRRWH